MVESSCPICASSVLPDQSHCPRCGASLAGQPTGLESTQPEMPSADFDTSVDVEPYEDPRLALLLEPSPDKNSLERLPGGYVPPSPGLEPSARAMRPSTSGSSPRQPGPSISLQLGAKPVSLVGREVVAATPEPAPGHALEGPPGPPSIPTTVTPEPLSQPEPAPAPEPFAAPAPAPIAVPARSASPFAVPPVAATAPRPPEATPAAATPKESVQELVTFALVAAGVSIGIASLFLPWAGVTGIGIGTEMVPGSPPPPNQWGWGMPAGLPLFLLSLLVLVGAAGSDRIQARFPNLALVVSRVTDLILPIILGGLYLGVVLMYMTVPASYGPGLYLGQFALLLGAGLLIAGAVVTVFFPPEKDQKSD